MKYERFKEIWDSIFPINHKKGTKTIIDNGCSENTRQALIKYANGDNSGFAEAEKAIKNKYGSKN